jgi:hypothetical protein
MDTPMSFDLMGIILKRVPGPRYPDDLMGLVNVGGAERASDDRRFDDIQSSGMTTADDSPAGPRPVTE